MSGRLEVIEDLARVVGDVGFADATHDLSADEMRLLRRAVSEAKVGAVEDGRYWQLYPGEGIYARSRYPKHLEHYRAGLKARERAVMGGNRVGKTEMGAYETVAHLTGEYPDWWEGVVFHEPTSCWAAGKTNETVRDIIQEKVFGRIIKSGRGQNEIRGGGMLPLSRIVPESVTFKTGTARLLNEVGIRYRDSREEYSTLGFKAYEQGRGSFEGTAKHWIWLDEECPIDVYNECLIRTGTVDGRVVLTFTPLEGMTETVIQFLSEELRPVGDGDDDEWSEW